MSCNASRLRSGRQLPTPWLAELTTDSSSRITCPKRKPEFFATARQWTRAHFREELYKSNNVQYWTLYYNECAVRGWLNNQPRSDNRIAIIRHWTHDSAIKVDSTTKYLNRPYMSNYALSENWIRDFRLERLPPQPTLPWEPQNYWETKQQCQTNSFCKKQRSAREMRFENSHRNGVS